MEIVKDHGRYELKATGPNATTPPKSVAGYGKLFGLILSFFGFAFSLRNTQGETFWLNRRSGIKVLRQLGEKVDDNCKAKTVSELLQKLYSKRIIKTPAENKIEQKTQIDTPQKEEKPSLPRLMQQYEEAQPSSRATVSKQILPELTQLKKYEARQFPLIEEILTDADEGTLKTLLPQLKPEFVGAVVKESLEKDRTFLLQQLLKASSNSSSQPFVAALKEVEKLPVLPKHEKTVKELLIQSDFRTFMHATSQEDRQSVLESLTRYVSHFEWKVEEVKNLCEEFPNEANPILKIVSDTKDPKKLADLFRCPGWDVKSVKYVFGDLVEHPPEAEFAKFLAALEPSNCEGASLNALISGLNYERQPRLIKQLSDGELLGCIERQSGLDIDQEDEIYVLFRLMYELYQRKIPSGVDTARVVARALVTLVRNNYKDAEIFVSAFLPRDFDTYSRNELSVVEWASLFELAIAVLKWQNPKQDAHLQRIVELLNRKTKVELDYTIPENRTEIKTLPWDSSLVESAKILFNTINRDDLKKPGWGLGIPTSLSVDTEYPSDKKLLHLLLMRATRNFDTACLKNAESEALIWELFHSDHTVFQETLMKMVARDSPELFIKCMDHFKKAAPRAWTSVGALHPDILSPNEINTQAIFPTVIETQDPEIIASFMKNKREEDLKQHLALLGPLSEKEDDFRTEAVIQTCLKKIEGYNNYGGGVLLEALTDKKAKEVFAKVIDKRPKVWMEADFPYVRMLALLNNSKMTREVVQGVLADEKRNLIPLLEFLEQSPGQLVLALPLDPMSGARISEKLFPNCDRVLKWYTILSSAITKDDWQKARQIFESEDSTVKECYLESNKGADKMQPENYFAITCDDEMRQDFYESLDVNDRTTFAETLAEWPKPFLLNILNPWGSVFLDNSTGSMKGEYKFHECMANLDPLLKDCFADNWQVKPDRKEEAELRLKWYYGKATVDELLSPIGLDMLFNNCQQPLSLSPLFNDDKTADYTLHVDDQKIRAHKFILAGAFQFFASTSISSMKEKDEMTISGHSYEAVYTLIQAAYSGHFPEFDDQRKADEFAKALQYFNPSRSSLGTL